VLHIFLRLFNHLHCFVPFFLERSLRLLDFLLLNIDPSINLFLLRIVSSRGALICLKHFVDKFLLALLTEHKTLFAEFDQLGELVVVHYVLELLLGEVLERVPIEERVRALTRRVIDETILTRPLRLHRQLKLFDDKVRACG